MDSTQVQIQPSSQGRSRSAHKSSNTVRPTRDFLQLSSRYKTYEELKKKQAKVAGRILTYGLIDEEGKPPARPLLWKTMLGVLDLEVNRYLEWVKKGPSEFSEKIKNDTFRTMATDTQFKGKVKEEMLIILLEAFVWKSHDRQDGEMEFTYVQGMNVLAAPFLYAMPTQVEAFACFSTFIEEQCPLYVQPTLVGVHRGLELLDRCLEVIDPKMYHHLKSKHLKAQLYALPSVMTFCAATPPLEEVLKLWDFLFCHGAHLNILFVIAQMDLCSQDIMNSPSPMKVLRTLPPLNAESIIARTMIIIGKVPADLYEELVEHPYKPVDNRRFSSSSGSSMSSRGW